MQKIVFILGGETLQIDSCTIQTPDGVITILFNHENIYGSGMLMYIMCDGQKIIYNQKGTFLLEHNQLHFIPEEK